MASFADWAEKAAIDWLFGGATPTRPTSRNIALYTVLPSEDGTGGTEVSTGSWTNYARVASSYSAASTGNPSSTSNSGLVDFGTATTTGNITVAGFGVLDQSGNLIAAVPFSPSVIVQNGNPVNFQIGGLTVTLD